MRLGWVEWRPVIYWAEESTGKLIDGLVHAKLQQSAAIESACSAFLQKNSNSASAEQMSTSTSVCYESHRLVTQIAEGLKAVVIYANYQAASEGDRLNYANLVAAKIVEWMAEQFGDTGIEVSYWEKGPFKSCLKVEIQPQIPMRDEMESIISQVPHFLRNKTESTTP